MNDVYLKIEALCSGKGIDITTMCKEAKISRAVLSEFKMGRTKKLSTDTLAKIAKYFGVSFDYLVERSYPSNMEVFDRETGKLVATYKDGKKVIAPTLTDKDERDIEKSLVQTLSALEEGQAGLMFDGEPLDDITRELLAASLRNSMEMAKKLAKEKYGRKTKED